jgi:hypothetical protein
VQSHHQNILQKLLSDLFLTYFSIRIYKSFNAQKKFGNHFLTPSNGLGIAATRLTTLRPY